MSNMTVEVLLKMVDELTGPARKAVEGLEQFGAAARQAGSADAGLRPDKWIEEGRAIVGAAEAAKSFATSAIDAADAEKKIGGAPWVAMAGDIDKATVALEGYLEKSDALARKPAAGGGGGAAGAAVKVVTARTTRMASLVRQPSTVPLAKNGRMARPHAHASPCYRASRATSRRPARKAVRRRSSHSITAKCRHSRNIRNQRAASPKPRARASASADGAAGAAAGGGGAVAAVKAARWAASPWVASRRAAPIYRRSRHSNHRRSRASHRRPSRLSQGLPRRRSRHSQDPFRQESRSLSGKRPSAHRSSTTCRRCKRSPGLPPIRKRAGGNARRPPFRDARI